MKKLIDQLLKFGVVGGICFLIDYIIALVILKVIIAAFGGDAYNTATLIGGGVGFTVSVIANYILSFKFVFERKEDLNRKTEFVIFVVLSIIGLGVNELILMLGATPARALIPSDGLAFTFVKVIATGVVMVYNFVTRKIFLEKK